MNVLNNKIKNMRLMICKEYELVEIENELLFLPTTSRSIEKSKVFSTNTVASRIVKLIQEGNTEQDIILAIQKEYIGDDNQIKEDVHCFIQQLLDNNIIIYEDEND